MNWDQIEGNWTHAKGKLQEHYGVAVEEAHKQQIAVWAKMASDAWFPEKKQAE